MSNAEIIIQIMFISIGMTIVGMVLNRLLGLRKENLQDLREKGTNLQERIRNAQLIGDYQLMAQLQRESVLFLKSLMKKQLIPTCARCIFFIGIFMVIGFIYADYSSGLLAFPILFFGDGWFALYFLFSIGLGLMIYGIKRLYFKLTGKERKSQSQLRELMGMFSPSQTGAGLTYQSGNSLSSAPEFGERPPKPPEKSQSWKDRIED